MISSIGFARNCLKLLVLFISFHNLHCLQHVPELGNCEPGEEACIAQALTNILNKYSKGIPSIGLLPVDDIKLKNMVISKIKGNTPIQLGMVFDTMNVYGIEKATITRVEGFEKNLSTSKFEAFAFIPNITISGKYKATGKVLLMPLNGNGMASLTLLNVKVAVKLFVSENIVDGKSYLVINKVKSILEPEAFHLKMDNLVDGDKVLNDSVNEVINANWQDLWHIAKKGVSNIISEIVQSILAAIVSSLPYENFFKETDTSE